MNDAVVLDGGRLSVLQGSSRCAEISTLCTYSFTLIAEDGSCKAYLLPKYFCANSASVETSVQEAHEMPTELPMSAAHQEALLITRTIINTA